MDALARTHTSYSQPHKELQEHAPCPLCGSDAERLVIEVQDTMFGKPGKYRLVECQQCAMRYLNPRPAASALMHHYPADYLCYTNFDNDHWLLRWAFQRMQQGHRVLAAGDCDDETGAGGPELEPGDGTDQLSRKRMFHGDARLEGRPNYRLSRFMAR